MQPLHCEALLLTEYIMARTVDALRAILQGHLKRHLTQAVIDSEAGAYTKFRETMRAAFACVERAAQVH